jgi:hypothetical protein
LSWSPLPLDSCRLAITSLVIQQRGHWRSLPRIVEDKFTLKVEPHPGPTLKPKQRKDGTWYADDWITNEANEYFRQRAVL